MRRRVFLTTVALAVLVGTAMAESKEKPKTPQQIAAHLQDVSVTIKAGYAEGSGTAIVREIGKEKTTFIWTAAHVVDGLRKTKEVIAADGTKRTKVAFDDCALVQEVRQDGRRVGEWKFDAQIVKFSAEQDLALLKVRKVGFLDASAAFHLAEDIPAVGTELFHCGSPGGQSVGANSVTDGSVAQIGRTFQGEDGEFDQATVSSLPGSSGGGVFDKTTGEYVGMLTMGLRGQDSFAYYIPVRRMQKWAKDVGLLWAIDPSVDPPTPEELKKIPVEDAGEFNKMKDLEKEGLYYLLRIDCEEIHIAPAC